MSCFQVSDNHISAIIGFACRNNLRAGLGSNPSRYAYTPGYEQEAFDLLYAANARSLNARYHGDVDTDGGTYNPKAVQLRPLEVIKAIQCMAYQCDEWEGFEGSTASDILRDIKEAAILKLPGYDSCAWAIE